MDRVYVVVYNDLKDNAVNLDVYLLKKGAFQRIEKHLEMMEMNDSEHDRIEHDYDPYWNLVYFAMYSGDTMTYECFLREEEVQ